MLSDEVSYTSYLRLIRQLDELVAVFENHPDPATREQTVALLSGLDMLHHEGLGRLIAALRNNGAGELLDRTLQDPIIRTLFGLYGLAELDLPEEPAPAAAPAPLVQLTIHGKKPKADWIEIARTDDVPPDGVLTVEAEGISVLLVNPGDDIHAYRNASPDTGLPLGEVWLEGDQIVCSPSGDRFDVRTGHRSDEGEGRLDVYPIAVRGPSIRLARQRLEQETFSEEAP
jgi:nitrite reductase/ring-hydroxylating ferredoxin subunit